MYDPQGYSQLSAAIAQAQMMVPGQSPAVNGVGPRMQLGMHHVSRISSETFRTAISGVIRV